MTITYHTADNASDSHEATLARRGSVAGKLIGCAQITDSVRHSFVVPDELAGDDEAVAAFGVEDFWTTAVPLCEPDVLAEMRVKAMSEGAAP
jgi:hypothetical protein